MGHNIIPSNCLKFVAACATAGATLEENSKGVSNTYSKDKPFDPDEPGNINYFLSKDGPSPIQMAKIWRNPVQELEEGAALDSRLRNCKDPAEWAEIADEIEILQTSCAIANICLFSQGRLSVDSTNITQEEMIAGELLEQIPDKMRKSDRSEALTIAAELSKSWNPSMFAWVKTWIKNYLELKHTWKAANPSIKIERDDSPFPIIIPKGKDFKKLLRRWA